MQRLAPGTSPPSFWHSPVARSRALGLTSDALPVLKLVCVCVPAAAPHVTDVLAVWFGSQKFSSPTHNTENDTFVILGVFLFLLRRLSEIYEVMQLL